MKNLFIIIICALFLFSSKIYSQQNIMQDRAWEIVQSNILNNNLQNINVFVSNEIIEANSPIKTIYRDEKSPAFDAWFFFIDDKPFASWTHHCRYVYVNIKDGTFQIIDGKVPPLFDQMRAIIEKKMDSKGIISAFSHAENLRATKQTPIPAVNDYAVIISGGANAYNNWVRYWNHCSAIYSALINVYGYPKDHIYVLISDGTDPANDRHLNDLSYDSSPLDLDGDGAADTQYSATRANITKVFNTLRNRLTPNDNLFIYTTDHGGQETGTDVYINLWNNEIMRDDEFAIEVNKVNAGRINLCMVQCHSGGFIDDLQANNRVITTACRYDESAYAMPPDYLYSEFTYHWVSAIAGKTPQGRVVNSDSNNDGIVSMWEAFQYARNHDTRNEHPQYSSTPTVLGQVLNLRAFALSGPPTPCTQAEYKIENLPAGTTVQWSASNNVLKLASGQGTAKALFKQTGFGKSEMP